MQPPLPFSNILPALLLKKKKTLQNEYTRSLSKYKPLDHIITMIMALLHEIPKMKIVQNSRPD